MCCVAETVSTDLESFASHAGRSTIKTADVMLLARRNEGLEGILRAFVEERLAEKEKTKAKGKGKERG